VQRALKAMERPLPVPKPVPPPKRQGRRLELENNPIAGIPFDVLAQRLHQRLIERGLRPQPVEKLESVFRDLRVTERELLSFAMSWGLHGDSPQTDRQIGLFLGVSRTIVGRWRNSAHEKMTLVVKTPT
jgi:DNA-directed RNA polymerase sigma subunit (sigma70/sigma32)